MIPRKDLDIKTMLNNKTTRYQVSKSQNDTTNTIGYNMYQYHGITPYI
jgi:hypothetical protein